MSEPRAPRFSDAALKVLVEQDKLAHKPRNPACSGERPASIQATTQMEQEALDIVEIYSRRSIENGEAGGQVPQDISHYLGLSGREMEEDHLTKDALPSAPSYQYNTELNTSVVRDGTDGSTRVELFSSSEQDLAMVDRTVQETDDRRASSDSSYTEEHRDLDLSGPAFKRKIFHVHHQLLEALDNLSRSCLTLSESVEESASILCGVLPQGLATLQSTMENVTNTLDATVKPSVRESVSPELASLIEAQTSAIQALTCTISSGLERLGGCIDRGFNHVTELLRSAFPYVSDNVESQSHGHGRVGEANAAVSHSSRVPAPLPCPQFQAPPVTETILQSTLRPPHAQTLRDQRS
ncbi:uncharacterized protein [Hemitrygon akajei]|uniref:uncharacterized protein isoform X2 n=1 Tax=Hemitrygon akajei TaxID=2704970 RepID=UPI003BF965F4